MTTLRLQIVDAIAAAIATATPTAKHFRDLDYALESEKTPAVAVVSSDDMPEDGPQGLRRLFQQVDIDVHVLIGKSAAPETAADPFEAAIHKAIVVPASFASQAVRTERLPCSWDFSLGNCADRTLRYRIHYQTALEDLEAS